MNLPATSARPRFAAWLLALVYWLSLPGVAPAALASWAAISDEHKVQVVFDSGHFDVVLHHDDDHHEHVHEGLTKLVTGIAVHDHDDDHVLHFASSSDASSLSSTVFNVAPVTAACVP